MSRFASAPWPLRATLVVGALAVAALLIAALSAVIALAGLRRLSDDIDALRVPAWFWHFREDPLVQRWLKVGLLSSTGLMLVTTIGITGRLRRPLHGASRWANEAEIRRGGLRAETGIVLGWKGSQPLVFGGSEHVMLYAPTRTGKGVGVVIPNLLTWPDSVVVLDVKRENWDATAGFRAAHGQEVFLFDPLDPEGRTARFNPFGHIDHADPIAVLDELQRIATMLFPLPPHTDPFWTESARTGFVGVGAYLAATPERPFTLGGLYAELTRGDPRTRFPAIVKDRTERGEPLSAGCVRALNDFCASSDNTFAGVRQTLTSRLSLWLNPRVCAATAASDFNLAALRSRRTSIYLAASPDNLSRVAPCTACCFSSCWIGPVASAPTRSATPSRSWCFWTSSRGSGMRKSSPRASPMWRATASACSPSCRAPPSCAPNTAPTSPRRSSPTAPWSSPSRRRSSVSPTSSLSASATPRSGAPRAAAPRACPGATAASARPTSAAP